MKDKTKQIDTIIKTFALLNLLLKDNADFTEVLKAISNNDTLLTSDNGTYNVMLSKYLNTLKLFGLDVKKEKGYDIEIVSVKTFSDAVNYLEGLKWDTMIKMY